MSDGSLQIVQLKDFEDPADPITNASGAQAAFEAAQAALEASGGGVIVISSETNQDFTVRTSLEHITVFDARNGLIRLQQASQGEPISGSASYPEGSLLVRGSQQQPSPHFFGAYAPQAILQRNIHGGNSLRTELLDPDQDGVAVHRGLNASWYPASIENVFVGQPFDVNDDPNQTSVVKSLGWDSQLRRPYFVADAPKDVSPQSLISNKTNLGALWVISEDHSGNQASAQTIVKNAYGEGDAFGLAVTINYLGNIMSAQGDEGAVAYAAEITQNLQNFRAKVESFDAATGELQYQQAGAINTERLATFRPIINLNSSKWITSGKVRIYISTTYPNEALGITQGVIQGVGTNWDPDVVVGRYFAVDDPSEYVDPHESGGFEAQVPPETRLRRWFRITNFMTDPANGNQLIFVRVVRWGTQEGQPELVNSNNYHPYTERELNYIIAPGANVADVSRGAKENDNVIGLGPRQLILQPNGDFLREALPFAPGDLIEQAIGSYTWNPTGFRVRHFNYFPTQRGLGDVSFFSANWGTAPVTAGLVLLGESGIEEAAQRYRHARDAVAYYTGISFDALMARGIDFNGELLPPLGGGPLLLGSEPPKPDPRGVLRYDSGLAIVFNQSTGNKKAIAWSVRDNSSIYATFGFDPDTHSYYLHGGQAIDVTGASLNRVKGVSGSGDASNNLRGINVPVRVSSNSASIQFPTAEKDVQYAIQVTPSWLTTVAVSKKQATGFDIQFGTPAPDNATVDWFLVR